MLILQLGFVTFPLFVNATNLFNSTMHHACSPTSTKISIDILTGGGCILQSPLFGPCIHTHQTYNVISAYLIIW